MTLQGLGGKAGLGALALAALLNGCSDGPLEAHALNNATAGGRTLIVVPERVFGRRATGPDSDEVTQRDQDVRDARIELATPEGRVLEADAQWVPGGGAYFAEIRPGHLGAWKLELPCDLPPDVPQTLRVRALESDGSVRLEGTLQHTCYAPRSLRWVQPSTGSLLPIPQDARFVLGSRMPGQLTISGSEGFDLSATGVQVEAAGVEVVKSGVAPSGNVWRMHLETRALGRGVRVAAVGLSLELPLEVVPQGTRPLALSPWYSRPVGGAEMLSLRAHWVDPDGQAVFGGGIDQCVWSYVTTDGKRVTGIPNMGGLEGDCFWLWSLVPNVPQLREVCASIAGQEACQALP